MTRCVVTGAAGFIGSSLVLRLIADGCAVLGIDSFDAYYSRAIKEHNLADVRAAASAGVADGTRGRFTFVEGDVSVMDLSAHLGDCDVLFHLAARPGVRQSWGAAFAAADRSNILATQRLLEAAAASPTPPRIVFASSSSVYGENSGAPSREDDPLRPASPYGVTKLCCEHLCRVYAETHGLAVFMLRYFTVYGPRQRPDMAVQQFIAAALSGEPLTVCGTGEQSRDLTFIEDAIEATVRAAFTAEAEPGRAVAINIGGGSPVTVNRIVGAVAAAVGVPVRVVRLQPRPGDVEATCADTSRLERVLGLRPRTPLDEGVACQTRWVRASLARDGCS